MAIRVESSNVRKIRRSEKSVSSVEMILSKSRRRYDDEEEDSPDEVYGGYGNEVDFRNKLVVAGGGSGLQNRIVAVVGRKGSGKSTLTREIMQHCTRQFVFDTMGEHNWIPDPAPDLAEAEIYIFEHGTTSAPFMGSYTPESDELEGEFSQICTAVYEAGNMTLVVEELP